ncbi:MAG TPA: enoyl-CoA hydratase/isomerase [Xanthobacteraceae bacterium]|nr:enoyl-CoA hydratase/isomerase [Xanthobacteraceae bacterium]
MEFARASLEIDGAVAILSMNHPEVLNALSEEMLKGMSDALDALAGSNRPVRCLMITGAGRAFSAGANLQEREEAPLPGRAGRVLETLYHPFLRRLRDLPYPLVTAVNGAAAGAGMSIALMGDLVLCARSAYFLQAFRRIGLVPDCGSTWLLPRLIGRARAIELSLLGERLPAETALAWGLVNHVYDDAALISEARKLAHELAAGPTVALGLIRRLYWESTENSHEEQLDLEVRLQRTAGASADAKEGVQAFLQKRAAKFAGV